ncbi:hypothetical protein EBZ39_19840 [bacterium]|nr:hypothetical protein [bacterium]
MTAVTYQEIFDPTTVILLSSELAIAATGALLWKALGGTQQTGMLSAPSSPVQTHKQKNLFHTSFLAGIGVAMTGTVVAYTPN